MAGKHSKGTDVRAFVKSRRGIGVGGSEGLTGGKHRKGRKRRHGK